MQVQAGFAYPGSLETITGGYTYARRLLPQLETLGYEVKPVSLGEAFPLAAESHVVAAAAMLAAQPRGLPVIVDGLALGIDPRLAEAAAARGPLVALVHHPLALETGLSPEVASRLAVSEKAALAYADRVVVPSEPAGASLIADYGVAPERLSIAKPGVERPPFAKGSGGPHVQLLAVAAISPRKGLDVLVRALEQVADLGWRLDLVGNDAIDPQCAADLRAQIEQSPIAPRIELFGAMDQTQLAGHYGQADVFVLASLYEGYGMVYAEAMAHGLPIIATTGGAIPSVVPLSAGILAKPGDVDTLAEALRVMISDRTRRAAFAAGAREASRLLPEWSDTARVMAAAIEAAREDWRRR
jgi:glycosyltransferase involved in cell wall biosynthesis